MKKIKLLTLIILCVLCICFPIYAQMVQDINYNMSAGDLLINDSSSNYNIMGKTDNYNIVVDGGVHTIVLNDVTINCEDDSKSGIELKNNANVTLIINGNNLVKGSSKNDSENSFAGILVPENCTLTIKELELNKGYIEVFGGRAGAGIGGINNVNAGTINIESGSIISKGTCNGAGIGGANYSDGGIVNISGGYVEAKGSYSSGIGAGTYKGGIKVNISGGTVIAKGMEGSAGIGEGRNCYNNDKGVEVVVTGGNVCAIGANNIGVEDIGRCLSSNGHRVSLTNGKENVYLTKIVLSGVPKRKEITAIDIGNYDYNYKNVYPAYRTNLYNDNNGKVYMCMCLPENTECKSITVGDVTYHGYVKTTSDNEAYAVFQNYKPLPDVTFGLTNWYVDENEELVLSCRGHEYGAKIFYDVVYKDGKGNLSNQKYTRPIVIDRSCTITAWAEGKKYLNSNKVSRQYNVRRVKEVVIQGAPKELTRGSKGIFSYYLDYEYLTSSQVGMTWSIESEHSDDTYFDNGELYVGKNEKSDSLTVKLTSDYDKSKYAERIIKVRNPKLISIFNPSPINNVLNGTKLNNIELPNTIKVRTENNIESVDVKWNIKDVQYNPDLLEKQSFIVNGKVVLPSFIDENGVSLDVNITINVLESDIRSITGKLVDYNGNAVAYAKIKIIKGDTNTKPTQETMSDCYGNYAFFNATNGVYSLVAESMGQTVTKTIKVNNKSVIQNLQLPNPNINTVLDVKNDSLIIAVDNLENAIETPNSKTEIMLVVEEKTEKTVEGKEIVEGHLGNNEIVRKYLNAELIRTIKEGIDAGKSEKINPKKGCFIKITVNLPLELWSKNKFSIIRVHDGVAQRLDTIYDRKYHTLQFETDKFSTYAITTEKYDELKVIQVKNKNKSNYSIKAESTEGGNITPSGVITAVENSNVTYKITANEGYDLYKLLVDDVSVEYIEKYTFKNIDKNHTIKAIFKRNGKNPFSDISKDNDYYNDIIYVYMNNIMNGTSKKTFSPEITTTRAMLVSILWRIENKPEGKECSFKDLEDGKYYVEAVKWGANNGIVKGYTKYKFAPNREINIQELVAILYRYAQFKREKVDNNITLEIYDDNNEISSWALSAMKWAVKKEIMIAGEDGLLRPKEFAKRYEFAQMITRLLSK